MPREDSAYTSYYLLEVDGWMSRDMGRENCKSHGFILDH